MRMPELGNPLTSEEAAFRWLVGVLLVGAVVLVLALLISSLVAVLFVLVVVVLAGVLGVRRFINRDRGDRADTG